jgi:hypothetical protein
MTTPDIAGQLKELWQGCIYMRDSSTNCVVDPEKTDALLTKAARTIERQAAEIERLRWALAVIPKTAKTLRIATSTLVLAGKREAAEMVTSVADGFEAIARAALTGEDAATLGLSGKTQTDARTRGD